MMKKLLCFVAIVTLCKINAQSPTAPTPTYAASNFTLCSITDPETNVTSYGTKYSACYGWYQANKNREYAIAGSSSGTYWVDVTNPYAPTVCCFRPGKNTNSTWREMKTYQNYCYVVTDVNTPTTFQIFDMQYLPDSVHMVYDSKALFERGHTCWVDGSKLYVSGLTYSNSAQSSLNVYSLATPTAPTLIRKLSQDANFISYVHDCFASHDTVFASCGNQGLYAFLLTSPSNTFQQIGSLTTYPFSGYNHATALTPNRKTLVMLDEVPAQLPIKIVDVQNMSNMQVLSTINQYTSTTPHNPFMVNDSLCFISSYCDGLQLLNIKNPSTPFFEGYFDTHPQGGYNVGNYPDDYDGLWSAYPFLPSKNIIAVDEQNGIFVLKTHKYANTFNPVDNNLPPSGVGTSTGSTLPTNIQVKDIAQNIVISPNPANGSVFLIMSDVIVNTNLAVEMFDVKGQQVLKQNLSDAKNAGPNHKEINTSQLDNGVYFLRISMDKATIKNTKLIIAH
jgi:choice-of-anchor B domain-containing protein